MTTTGDHDLHVGYEMARLHARVLAFQRDKFPHQTLRSKLTHLVREAEELLDCQGTDSMEWADVFLLFLGSADLEGHTVEDLIRFAHAKMDINERRDWHPPDAEGVHHHKD